MNSMEISTFERAANAARSVIGKPVVADYTVMSRPGPIQQAVAIALFYGDARTARRIVQRDLALAEVKRQVASTTK